MLADQFFTNYSINVKLGYYSLTQALEDLREAYKLYPQRTGRIISMAVVVKIGLKKYPQIELLNKKQRSDRVAQVMEALF